MPTRTAADSVSCSRPHSDTDAAAYLRAHVKPYPHLCATAPMGPDAVAAVPQRHGGERPLGLDGVG